MIIKKIVHYFSIIVIIFLATTLVLSLFYIKFIYHQVILTHKSELPSFIIRVIDRFESPRPQVVREKPEETIQIPEGWTNKDIADYLATKENWTNHDFLRVAGSAQKNFPSGQFATSTYFSNKFPFLKNRPSRATLEGYLFPDTYQVYASSTVKEIISKMLSNFNKKLTPKMRADIKSQGKTIYEIITMASLVEKEAPINYQQNGNRDARIIAGIFWDRLKNGQALESDATLSYILNDQEAQHQGKSLEIDSRYNTYKYPGLPPGPISNPGILAIQAAIYPIYTKYNYFLTPSGTQKVVYAETYAQHLRNRYKYLR